MMEQPTRIPSDILTEMRLDATYYARKYLDNAQYLAACGLPMKPVGDIAVRCNCGATPKNVVYDGAGTGVVRTTDVRPNIFHDQGVQKTSALAVSADSATAALAGDLLYTMSGTIGYAAVIPDGAEMCSFSNTIARTRFQDNGEQDARFTAAFFNCSYGYTQSLRLVSGGIQGHVMPNPFKRLPVPCPQGVVQAYVGNKVRQAERLRERARALEQGVLAIHQNYIPVVADVNFGKKTRRLPSGNLTERLDAHFYPSAVEQYLSECGCVSKSIGSLSEQVANGQSRPDADSGVPQATVTNLGASFVGGKLRSVTPPSDVSRYLQQHDLLLCNAAHSKEYIGREVTYCQREGIFPSTEIMTIRVNRDVIPASYLRAYLLTKIGYLQIQSTIRGITAHSYPSDVKTLDIPVPNVPPVEREAWFSTDDQMIQAGQCVDTASLLTKAATQLVEHLIEGEIIEADLIDAQKQLDAGDPSADRAILGQLRAGQAEDAPPLFPDLDALYALLDADPNDEDGD